MLGIYYPYFSFRAHSSVGRALPWHGRGQRFEPAWVHRVIGPVAQLVERHIRIVEVSGSSPLRSTRSVAQWLARSVRVAEVVGSNPTAPTQNGKTKMCKSFDDY